MMIVDLVIIDLAHGALEMALDPPLGFRVEARMEPIVYELPNLQSQVKALLLSPSD